MSRYSVTKLAKLAGVSVRTLHLYDEIGLLKPSIRTEARYRLYGEKELLRLQQILFYKELDFSLQEICTILDNPDFDLVQALEGHKSSLKSRRARLTQLLLTIDKTIVKLKDKQQMITDDELYAGFAKGQADAYRNEAIRKWGAQAVEQSEKTLRQMSKADFTQLKAESEEITQILVSMLHLDPESESVQKQIIRHYTIIRKFWGTVNDPNKQAEAYSGLGKLYVTDERYTVINGKPNPEFALFMSKAMSYFAKTQLKE
ncbi:MerR family transcriptional regulator [Xanthocytophaga agilis]|uniref:MerR family transcriptional regulator n=1 Tax=Xanthocytophaga agilis TaxID=3048010 RepID=A0AAE3R2B7_9BACT|nr:MerR family transcriptional regulator [Xanthocytophaga agilis]MDJ1499583.1 MerR family transcriptional regulator [Xanthocytophaga agilis]